VLGLAPGATADDVKRAFRAIALRTHPDHGGDQDAFIDAKRAHDVALAAADSPRRRRRAR
jgi:curved DNA-binding protein CbpA